MRRAAPVAPPLLAALAAAALAPACGSEPPASDLVGRGPEFFAAALESVEQTPEPLRDELLRTCDKWQHLDRACDREEVRRDQLECWVDKGERIHEWVQNRGLRPQAAITRTLLEVNVCMELKRWRKLKPGPDLDARR